MNIIHKDSFKWWPRIQVAKFHPDTVAEAKARLGGRSPLQVDFDRLGISPDEIVYAEGNELTNLGLERIAALISGTGQAFTTARSVIGVGNSSTEFSAAQTDLVGGSKYFQATASVTPSGAKVSAQATFTESNANFAWEEWCWVATDGDKSSGAAKPAGVMLNRKVQALGTKANGAVWTLSTEITLS